MASCGGPLEQTAVKATDLRSVPLFIPCHQRPRRGTRRAYALSHTVKKRAPQCVQLCEKEAP